MSRGKTFARRQLGERGCAPLGTANTTDGGGWRERSHRNRFLTVKAALTRAERKSLLCGMGNVERGMWNVECGTWNVERGMWNVECGTWNVECGMWNVEC